MTTLLAEEGQKDHWVVIWFPPEGDRSKDFGDDEVKARAFAARDSISKWHPLLEHRVVITVSELVPL